MKSLKFVQKDLFGGVSLIKWRLPVRNREFYVCKAEEIPEECHFATRNVYLTQIANYLQEKKCCVLAGLNGSGKTALAVEYCYQNISLYHGVFFISGNDFLGQLKTLVEELLKLRCGRLGISELCVYLLKLCHDSKLKYIFVFDDVEWSSEIEYIVDVMYESKNVDLLITSNNQHWISAIRVLSFTESEAMNVIKKYLPNESSSMVACLANNLGCLPLGLFQALTYIKSTAISIEEYIEFLNNRPDEILEKNTIALWKINYPYSLYKIITLSLEKIKQQCEISHRLLVYLSFFRNENIPKIVASKICGSTFIFNEAISRLLKYSLVTVSEDKNFLTIHCLVHKLVSFSIDDGDRKIILGEVYKKLHEHFQYSRNNHKIFRIFSSALPHYIFMIDAGKKYLGKDDFTAYHVLLMSSIGLYETFERHFIVSAREKLNKVMSLIKKFNLSISDDSLGAVYNGLGHTYLLEGEESHGDASNWFQKTVSLSCIDAIEVYAYSLSGLSHAKFYQGKIFEAIEGGKKALDLIKKHVSSSHIDISHFNYRLAMFYNKIQEYECAKKHCLNSVEYGKQLFDDGCNFDSAGASYILASILLREKNYDANQVISLLSYTADTFEKLIGDVNHPEVVFYKKVLARVNKLTGSKILLNYNHKKFHLTKREHECLKLVRQGKSAKQIGALLNISYRTVESHVDNIKSKFSCRTKLELISSAKFVDL